MFTKKELEEFLNNFEADISKQVRGNPYLDVEFMKSPELIIFYNKWVKEKAEKAKSEVERKEKEARMKLYNELKKEFENNDS